MLTKTLDLGFNYSVADNTYKKIMPLLDVLYCRWLDECEYESIKEYASPFENMLNKMFNTTEFTNNLIMTKRPFGFKLKCQYTVKNGLKVSGTLVMNMKEWKFKCLM